MKNNNKSLETRLDNRLSNFGIRNLNVIEQNLWWSIVRLIKDKGTNKLHFSRDDIEFISTYVFLNKSSQDFVKDMKSMGHKIVSINTELYDTERKKWIIFSLFPVFEVDEYGLDIQVSEYFNTWFNDIQKNFTRIDLSVLIGLKSSYSKELYRFLMRWKNLRKDNIYPGFWSVDINEFRRLLCIPVSYTRSDLERKILEPAKNELTKKNIDGWAPLEYLDIKLINQPGSKRKIKKIEFTFKQGELIEKLPDSVLLSTETITTKLQDTKAYSNNFENGYIPGKNSPTKVFKSWLAEVNLFKDNDEYFEMRSKSKTDLMSIYKSKVIDSDNKYWTDMRFFASAYSVIINDKAMTSWNIEDAYSEIRKGKRLEIPQEIYSSLPEEKGNQLQAFALKGEIA